MVSKLAKAQVLVQLLVGAMDGACGQRVYTLFVYLASLLIFYTSEKYLRGKAWNEMQSLPLEVFLSWLKDGEVFCKDCLVPLIHWCLSDLWPRAEA